MRALASRCHAKIDNHQNYCQIKTPKIYDGHSATTTKITLWTRQNLYKMYEKLCTGITNHTTKITLWTRRSTLTHTHPLYNLIFVSYNDNCMGRRQEEQLKTNPLLK